MKKLLPVILITIIFSSCGILKKNMESNFHAHRMDKVKNKIDQQIKLTAPSVTKD